MTRLGDKGTAAVEFALLLPVMVAMLVGMAEICGLVQAYGKALSATQTVSDLTSRSDQQSTATLDAIVSGARAVLAPLPAGTDRLGVRIASVGISSQGAPTQLWSYSWGTGAPAIDLASAAGMAPAGESVVMVSVAYTHPPLLQGLFGSMSFRETAVARPRVVRLIPLNGSTGVLP